MSTVTKLDPLVRVRRADRRAQLRALQGDLKYADTHLARGKHLLASAPKDATPESIKAIKEQIENLARWRIITVLTLDHVRKICRDPRRSGAAKHAILEKLAGGGR